MTSLSVVCRGSRIVSYARALYCSLLTANPDIALIYLEGVDLSPNVDVLGVSDELWDNRAILAHVQAQRIAQQRVKSAKGGTR
jgi:hypothetical protein